MLLQTHDLQFGTPDGKPLGKNISFEVNSGELLLISGSNGSGKSTLLRVLLGQLKRTGGQLKYGVSPRKIAVLPQLQNTTFHLPLTLLDVLEISLKRKLPVSEIIAVGLLDSVHLDLAWNTASGGERKRALLTRLILESPSLLMLDEPMNHLDQESRKRVRQAIFEFLKNTAAGSRGVILVSHEASIESDDAGATVKHLHLGALGSEYSRENLS